MSLVSSSNKGEESHTCQCETPESYPFLCPYWDKEIHPKTHEICKGTFLPEEQERYFSNWERLREQNKIKRLTFECPHKGEPVREIECKPCQGGTKIVSTCALFNECVDSGNVESRKQKIRECLHCEHLPENMEDG